MNHVKEVMEGQLVEEYHCWVDSTMVLCGIKGHGTWSQFVRNGTEVIQDKQYLKWHHVPTKDNPSDQGSRGTEPCKMGELWFKGPDWLSCPGKWPQQPQVSETVETAKDSVKPKFEKQLPTKEEEKNPIVNQLLNKYASYQKLLRIAAIMRRFIGNCKRKEKQKGPLTTEEIQAAEKYWIHQAQASQDVKSDVTLKDEHGILSCVGRVKDYNTIFLPRSCKLAFLIVKQLHEQMMHGGVSITSCRMREKFWVPKLRALTKKVIRDCTVCKRYRWKPLSTSPILESRLPLFRTELSDPFAGPVYYKITKSSTTKAYIALFTCASTRAVHLKLCRNLSATEFQRASKEFTARRGCPQTIVSDNGKTFVATGKWLSVLKRDHNLANFMGMLNLK